MNSNRTSPNNLSIASPVGSATETLGMDDLKKTNKSELFEDKVTLQEDGSSAVDSEMVDERTPKCKRKKTKREVMTSKKKQELVIKSFCRDSVQLLLPVSICMTIVITTMSTSSYYKEEVELSMFLPSSLAKRHSEDTGVKMVTSILIASALMITIVIFTFCIYYAYKSKYYTVLKFMMCISPLIFLFGFAYVYIDQFLHQYNIAMDYITLVLLLFNFSATGIAAINFKGPIYLQQFYLILLAVLMAVTFIKFMPSWAVYCLIGLLVVWDLVAVLCPRGPLKMLLDLEKERGGGELPFITYISSVLSAQRSKSGNLTEQYVEQIGGTDTYINKDDNLQLDSTTTSAQSTTSLYTINEGGLELGLGDFVFYSVLVGEVTNLGDWTTTLACFISLLVGLQLTLMIWLVYKKSLPALPISITLGLLVSLATYLTTSPWLNTLNGRQIYI